MCRGIPVVYHAEICFLVPLNPICPRFDRFSACCSLIIDCFLNVPTISACAFWFVAPGQNLLDLTLIFYCPFPGNQGIQGVFPGIARYSSLLSAHLLYFHLCSQSGALEEKTTEVSRTEVSRAKKHYPACSRKKIFLFKIMETINFFHFHILRKLQNSHQEDNYSFTEENIYYTFWSRNIKGAKLLCIIK